MKAMNQTKMRIRARRFPDRKLTQGYVRRGHLYATGAAFLATTIGVLLAAIFTIAAPDVSADKHNGQPSSAANPLILDSKFKGQLPITELTEDQAIMHALNRLGYGPRPGDMDRIRQMGLEKWID